MRRAGPASWPCSPTTGPAPASTPRDESGSDIDLRSANLLAVRGLGDIDDRSTLVNLLPTMAERLFDVPFTPAADSVEIIEKGTILPFQRPD